MTKGKLTIAFAALAVALSSVPAEAGHGGSRGGGGGGRGGGGISHGGSRGGFSGSFRYSGSRTGRTFYASSPRTYYSSSWNHHYPRRYYWGSGYPYWYLPYWSTVGWWYGGPYWAGSYYGPYGYGYYGRQRVAASRYAVVDTDISPEEAEVWLDGVYIGTADDFDGHPDYLYLSPGKYHLEFRAAGHDVYALDVDLHRGEKLNLDKKLTRHPGEGKLSRFDAPSKGMPSGRVFGPGAKPITGRSSRARVEVNDDDDDEEVNGEDPRDRDRVGRYDEGSREPRPRKVERMPMPAPGAERGRIRLKVTPDDAAVYLDDRYVGTADDLAANSRGLRADGGKHTLTVTRPGFKTKTIDVEATAGKSVDVVVELEK